MKKLEPPPVNVQDVSDWRTPCLLGSVVITVPPTPTAYLLAAG